MKHSWSCCRNCSYNAILVGENLVKKYWLIGIFSLLFMLAGGYLGVKQFSSTDNRPELAVLQQLELPDTRKNIRTGEEWLGQVVVVNHWATWCPPCLEEIPMLIDFNTAMSAKGVQVIGVAHDLLDSARAFGDQIGINYPSLVSIVDSSELLASHGNRNAGALPFTAIFDRDGQLVSNKLGKLSHTELASMVEPLL